MSTAMNRVSHLRTFYDLLDELAGTSGGPRYLRAADARQRWPERGVYFFLEPGEERSGSGVGPRVVRVGTHGLKAGSKSTLRGRLNQHRGTVGTGTGNHRGSIFRLLVGAALMSRDPALAVDSWGMEGSAPRSIREREAELERRVSDHLATMSVIVLEVTDAPRPESLRGYVERNAIGLLSNYDQEVLDPPSTEWLGHYCPRERVRRSGLWNNNHVDERYDPAFLDVMAGLARV